MASIKKSNENSCYFCTSTLKPPNLINMKEILEKSLLQRIERLEAFEERMMIRLENISIRINELNWIILFCEVHPVNGTKLSKDIRIECVIYDKEGAILEVGQNYLDEENFFGFEILEYKFYNGEELADKVGKIRIYPK